MRGGWELGKHLPAPPRSTYKPTSSRATLALPLLHVYQRTQPLQLAALALWNSNCDLDSEND